MPVEDVETVRQVRREISRRSLDISNLDIRVMHGVVYLRGKVDWVRGVFHEVDLNQELGIVYRVLKAKPGVRDVVMEVQYPGASFSSWSHRR